jgi:hypothetical protein
MWHSKIRMTAVTAVAAFAALALTALATFACGGEDDNGGIPATPTPPVGSPTAPPEETPGAGDAPAIIGRIVDAVESGDPAQLEALFVYQRIACVTASEGIGGPPLCEGEPEGTLLSVAPMAACEGYYAREGALGLQTAVTGTATFNAAYAFAGADFWPDAAYGVVFALPQSGAGPQAFAVMASDDGAIGLLYGCGWTVQEFADLRDFGDVIVESET